MKKTWLSLIILTVLVCLSACSSTAGTPVSYAVPAQASKFNMEENKTDVTEADALSVFNDVNQFSMPSLKSHSVSMDKTTLKIEFHFKNTAAVSEIESARSFAIEKFVLWKQSKFGAIPYDELISTQAKPKNIYSQIYIDDALLIQDAYIADDIQLFESFAVPYKARKLPDESVSTIKNSIQKQIPKAELSFEKSLLGYCMVIGVKTKTAVTESQLEAVKADIIKESDMIKPYGGIVLRLVTADGMEYTETLLNSANSPKWVTDDWMNYKVASVLNGVSVEKQELNIKLPKNASIKDPNIIGGNANYSSVEALPNGAHTSVVLNYVDSIISVDSHEVLLLQAFNIDNTDIEKAIFNVENINFETKPYTYSDISDHILYSQNGVMVVDVSFSSAIDFRAELLSYIAEKSGTQTYNIAAGGTKRNEDNFLYADETNIYKYDWMPPAFDYVTEHIKEMISAT